MYVSPPRSIYLVTHLAQQWTRKQQIICICIIFRGLFDSAVDNKGANQPNEPPHLVHD